MRKSYKYFLALALPLLAGCNSSTDVMYHIENPEDQMKLTASAEELTLDPDEADTEVLTFTWNAPADRGENAKLTTYFRMDIADNNFETATDLIEIPAGETSLSLTTDDVNEALTKWGISPGATVRLEAELIASVENPNLYMKPELSKTTLLVKGYKVESKPLWIVNDAKTLFDSDETSEIMLAKQYSWTGKFAKNTGIKFVFDKATQLPSLNKGADNNTLVRRTSASEPDNLFNAPEDGYYTVNLSTKTKKVSWEKVITDNDPSDYGQVFMVGNACPCGWNIGEPVPMTHDDVNPEIFYWEGYLGTGEMKLPLWTGNWGCDYLMPVIHYSTQDGDDNVQLIPSGNPDYKWNITTAGNYRVVVNTYLMKIKFIPLS